MVSQIDTERLRRGFLIEAVAKRILTEHKKYAERMDGEEWAKIAAAKLIDIVWEFSPREPLKKKGFLNESAVSTWEKIINKKVMSITTR
jgi:hypothetical protein